MSKESPWLARLSTSATAPSAGLECVAAVCAIPGQQPSQIPSRPSFRSPRVSPMAPSLGIEDEAMDFAWSTARASHDKGQLYRTDFSPEALTAAFVSKYITCLDEPQSLVITPSLSVRGACVPLIRDEYRQLEGFEWTACSESTQHESNARLRDDWVERYPSRRPSLPSTKELKFSREKTCDTSLSREGPAKVEEVKFEERERAKERLNLLFNHFYEAR